jgi:molybdate transport system substrate-binding protein
VLPALLLAIVAVSCGGGGDDNADEVEQGAPNRMVVWAVDDFQKPLNGIVEHFQTDHPDIEVEVEYGKGADLRDRLLLGERPDLYLNSELQLAKLKQDGFLAGAERSDFGANTLELVVAAGNPKGVSDLSVFGAGPLTSGLCSNDLACGRSAQAVLKRALVTPAPDVTATPKELLGAVVNGSVDATMLFRTQTVRARRDGTVQYVPLPENQQVTVPYKFEIVRRGDAVNTFLDYIKSSDTLRKLLMQSGFAPLEGDSS